MLASGGCVRRRMVLYCQIKKKTTCFQSLMRFLNQYSLV
jgi:hypothetical protein